MLLRTFGSLVLEGSGFTRPKPLLLLAYLALEGPQDRRHLAELFWPEAADHLKSLTVALTRLRQGASGATQADDERVWATVEVASNSRQNRELPRLSASVVIVVRDALGEAVHLGRISLPP